MSAGARAVLRSGWAWVFVIAALLSIACTIAFPTFANVVATSVTVIVVAMLICVAYRRGTPL